MDGMESGGEISTHHHLLQSDPLSSGETPKDLIREESSNYEAQHDLSEKYLIEPQPEHCNSRVQQLTFKVGDTYNVAQLLSSPSRDYLINSNHDQVKIHNLSSKYIILFLWGLSDCCLPHQYNPVFSADLEEMYSFYSPLGMLEIVFVAFGNDKDTFEKGFSFMPWLAIPHEDRQARDAFQQKFDIPSKSIILRAIVFDPQGMVLETNAHPLTVAFGAEGFPFSKQRIDQIVGQSDALWDAMVWEKQKPSMTSLFGQFLISSEGNKVPTSELEGKTVGLYFFEEGTLGYQRTSLLLELWESLKKNKQCTNFEIIFINADSSASHFYTDDFKKKFTIPWYVLPFDGRRLSRVFKVGCEDDLTDAGYFIVLEPDKYEILSYFALHIYYEFGIGAYPFTLERAVTIAKSKQKALVLDNLLDPSILLCKAEETSTVFQLRLFRKRVLLVFANISYVGSGSFLPTLKRMHSKRNGADENYEIIYISLDNPPLYRSMPCYVAYPLDLKAALFLFGQLFDHQFPPSLPAIASFGCDGHLDTKESNLSIKKDWNSKYPFIQGDMAEEVRRELVSRHKWDLKSL